MNPDGLRMICTCCKQFTESQASGYVDTDGDFIDQGQLSLCCSTEVIEVSEEEIEEFKMEDFSTLDPQELSERSYAIYQAVQYEENF